MTFWMPRARCLAASYALALGSMAFPGWCDSNFIRVSLGNNASIEVPRNWTVLSDNQRIKIDTFVEAKGYHKSESTLGFAANLYDDRGKTVALLNARFYPDNPLTQADARRVTAGDLMEIDAAMRRTTETSLNEMGLAKMTVWFGSKMQVIHGRYVLVHEHQHRKTRDKDLMMSRGLRLWESPHSLTVTISYRERDSAMLLPIVDYMSNSLRRE